MSSNISEIVNFSITADPGFAVLFLNFTINFIFLVGIEGYCALLFFIVDCFAPIIELALLMTITKENDDYFTVS